ncbi:hypothetical protein BK124_12685 [Paenibacillus amylolyticus]|uniref:DUF421 domain-containing protein n=1 Tax=Paenibacillus TaxID=44249 RepID=UPI0003E2542E|nr:MULTISPECIES: DUF421 domain-containing protein [Paenibacillus]ETT44639.1 hypothetical protein C170_24853 [Paenibacillus sp. FSL H7-689]MCP1422319.1 uncharacterized membrane protein YcaP (DUF421 family) [Paenibacillus xylanexedens]OME98089.1 hypothetical protein BK124_12685 [Paenibacillus amylolyticus]OMF06629.1 hypothetical protein BK129_13295 [Paenibacillus amylolyticus]
MDWIWKSVLLVLIGMILLRIAGRKSISQMSVATTVIMISIGTTIVQPIANHELGKAIGSASVFILTLLVVEQLQLKFNIFERLMSGSSKIVVEDGKVIIPNLKRMRYTMDQLEMHMRQHGITSVDDLETATVEPNGQLGYVLKRHARPVTIGDLEEILRSYAITGSGPATGEHPQQDNSNNSSTHSDNSSDIFQEVSKGAHAHPVDPKLQ